MVETLRITRSSKGGTQGWSPALVGNDRLFEIGNGFAYNTRINAFTVLTNGYIGLGKGTTPVRDLHPMA
jgi:hypothetical protein